VRILNLPEIKARINDGAVIDAMREALMAQARGECSTPMPMHLDTANGGEVHMKASYRRGGKYFALKMASTFQGKGNGMMMLASAESGEPVAYLADEGHLTDVRTAAVAAMVVRELGRRDASIGILGTGIQARLTARFHRQVLPLEKIFIWGRDAEKARRCADETGATVVKSPAELAAATRLIVTCTASRAPLLFMGDVQAGTHISAVGADSVGKQELDPEILRQAELLLVDSRAQCERLGELQHAPWLKTTEIGELCEHPWVARSSVADMTGLGVEDLFIAEMVTRSFL
jgi:ornithine cyclodeaminase/alanine dehydrogenase-like protein (mu-crystallin family)